MKNFKWVARQPCKKSWRPEMWLFGLFPLRPVPNSLFSFLFIQRRRDINGPLPPSLPPTPVRDRSFCVQTAKRIHSRRSHRPLHSLDLRDGHCALPSISAQQLRWECRDTWPLASPSKLIDSRGNIDYLPFRASELLCIQPSGCRPPSCPCQPPSLASPTLPTISGLPAHAHG